MIKIKASVPQFNEKWWDDSKGQLAKTLQEDNQLSWLKEQDPQTGEKWAPLSPRYKSWKESIQPGLTDSLDYRERMLNSDKNSTRLRSRSIFRDYKSGLRQLDHMTGKGRMPARPWLGSSRIFYFGDEFDRSQSYFQKVVTLRV